MECGRQHQPVMLAEAVEALAVRPDGWYWDATCGLGGHTREIARRLTTGTVVASDRDAESLALARKECAPWSERIRFVQCGFSGLVRTKSELGIPPVQGLLADLGVSMAQLTSPERGFSLRHDGPLDMRMDRSQELTAADLVNSLSERELADLIYQEGEERRARRVARAIVRRRPLKTMGELARAVASVVPRTGKLDPATLTALALRRAVNREREELAALLAQAPEVVGARGRIVIISFMSLEDRQVKEAFRRLAAEGRATLIFKKVVTPSAAEVKQNPAARSAKMRAIELC